MEVLSSIFTFTEILSLLRNPEVPAQRWRLVNSTVMSFKSESEDKPRYGHLFILRGVFLNTFNRARQSVTIITAMGDSALPRKNIKSVKRPIDKRFYTLLPRVNFLKRIVSSTSHVPARRFRFAPPT
jgi:hypothetical protein